jgi:hypothetical protein
MSDNEKTALELGSIVAAAGAFIAGVGAVAATGTLGRVQRNQGAWFALSVGCVIVGAALLLFASLLRGADARRSASGRHSRREKVTFVAIGLTAAGVVLGFGTAIFTADDKQQPTVSLSFDEQTLVVRANATASNLSSADRMGVYVDGLRRDPRSGRLSTVGLLAKTFVGPDSDGKARADLDVQMPPGRFDAIGMMAFTGAKPSDCGGYPRGDGSETGTGCVVLRMAPRPPDPELTASWNKRSVRLGVDLANAPVGGVRGHFVGLRLVGIRRGKPVLLYRAIVGPAAGGITRRTAEIPVGRRFRVICAHAHTIDHDARIARISCPVRHPQAGVSTVELRAPYLSAAWTRADG